MSLPLIILGGGGHAKVLIDALLLQPVKILGFVDSRPEHPDNLLGVPWLGVLDSVLKYAPETVLLVNAVGSAGATTNRTHMFTEFKGQGYSFARVIHPSAIVGSEVQLGEGVQLLAGAIVQVGSIVGDNTIVNTKASIDHDARVGAHVHLAPGVTLSGGVYIGDGSHLGTGANVIQGMRIGRNCVIGAGSLILRDIDDGMLAYGVPAREIREIG